MEAESKLKSAGIAITSFPVTNPERLADVMREAVASGAPMVIVGGGDGSLSGTVDMVVDREIVFALLPFGTANSFARTLGIPLDLDGAIEVIATGRRRTIDLARINGDYFANCAAIGLSPMIGQGIPRSLKKYLGRAGYLGWAIWCLVHFRAFRITIDDGKAPRSYHALEARICNGRFHGGVEVIEDNDVDTRDIVVQVVTGRAHRTLVWNWFATYFRLPARTATTQEVRGKRLMVTTHPPLKISIDGEVTAATPALCEVAERVIEIVVPR